MNFLTAFGASVVPLIAFVVPGIALIVPPRRFADVPAAAARIILWSITILTLLSFTAALAHLSVAIVPLCVVGFVLIGTWRKWRDPRPLWLLLGLLLPTVVLVVCASIPFLFFHDGLPTGDSQKAILWAETILRTQSLPDYNSSYTLLNRDPVDFYTPGLHALTATVMKLSAHPFMSVGLLSIAASLACAIVALAIATELFPQQRLVLLVPMLVLTNFRFLRYLREPGYHYQNIFGELLLFGLLLIALRLSKQWQWSDAALGVLTAVTLVITHQFSAFLAPFVLLPIAVATIFHSRHHIKESAVRFPFRTAALVGITVLLVMSGFALGLHHKIPHLFTRHPHLLHLIPSLLDYFTLMGTPWFIAGIVGLILFLRRSVREKNWLRICFGLATAVLLLLSQGPRLGIDIPPVRTLFYTVVPLSITAAFAVAELWTHVSLRPLGRQLVRTAIVIAVGASFIGSVTQAYALSHSVRTNATLTGEQLSLIEFLNTQSEGGVLVDDYNRRSASWLVVTSRAMYTRIAADISQQMQEAKQSNIRRDVYLNQLDFEKIFSLGSLPLITELMEKHNLRYLTGITSSSATSLQHNPALREAAQGGDIHLYEVSASSECTGAHCLTSATRQWLLASTTLVNDIGDREDTFEHLPISLRSTRLSDPYVVDGRTVRTTTAPLIVWRINVGDYVSVVWDENNDGEPDQPIQLLILAKAALPLTITGPGGATLVLPTDGTLLQIPADQVRWDEKGFITMTIHNPRQLAVELDVLAAGLSTTP